MQSFVVGHRRARARGDAFQRSSGGRETGPPKQQRFSRQRVGRSGLEDPNSLMILPQVHLRKPCYDFYFLYMTKSDQVPGSECAWTTSMSQSQGLTEQFNR